MEFVKGQCRHRKTILAPDAGRELLEMAGFELAMNEATGILLAKSADSTEIAATFIDAVGAHRHPSHESGPPVI